MPTVVPMPKLGAGVYKEGIILRWFKREGEAVSEREPLAEIETEKAVVTYESPLSGTVLKLITPEGASVQVGDPVCVIGDPGESVPPELIHKVVPKFEHPETVVKPAAGLIPSLQVSPAAKRLAESMNVNLKTVIGTGAGGMIMREDVLRTARSPSAPPQGDRQPELVRFSTMRATIAERLLKSQRETAHVTLTREVEVRNLVSLVKGKLANSGATYTDVFIKVAAEAIKRHPMVNAQLEGEGIRILDQININFAVAVEAGLTTPTVRAADKLSLTEVSRLARELSEKARARKLESTDYAGGTFTISNLGMFGVDAFTPIINPPQVAILGTGRILERPWVENGQLTVLPTMYLSLTFDHRVIDGADAARFLDTIVSLLTDLDWLP